MAGSSGVGGLGAAFASGTGVGIDCARGDDEAAALAAGAGAFGVAGDVALSGTVSAAAASLTISGGGPSPELRGERRMNRTPTATNNAAAIARRTKRVICVRIGRGKTR